MAMVTRLEMVAAHRVERVGGRDVVQYRGEVIPLLNLGQYLGAGSTATRSELPVAVYTRDERSIAMVVDEIVDIVEYNAAIHATDERGFIGSVVVKDRIIGLLDVEHAILAADPAFFTPAPKRSHSGPASETIRQHRRLLHSGNKS
jgi:two-component system chemotaxis sensor kinase CheA